jgi:hypothetical protein
MKRQGVNEALRSRGNGAMRARQQPSAGHRDDLAGMPVVEQLRDDVHGGEAGACEQNRSVGGDLGFLLDIPRVFDDQALHGGRQVRAERARRLVG